MYQLGSKNTVLMDLMNDALARPFNDTPFDTFFINDKASWRYLNSPQENSPQNIPSPADKTLSPLFTMQRRVHMEMPRRARVATQYSSGTRARTAFGARC